MSKKMKVIFTVSVLLNVFFIGIIVGGFSKSFNHQAKFRAEMDARLVEFISILPESEQSRFKSQIESLIENNKQVRGQIRSLHREITEIFEQESFDVELYRAKTEQIHNLRGSQMLAASELVGEMSAYLSVEQRAELSERLMRGPRRFKEHFDRFQEHRP